MRGAASPDGGHASCSIGEHRAHRQARFFPRENESFTMFPVRIVSLFAVVMAAPFTPACSPAPSDDVYSPDETRADIAPIAKGNAHLPIAIGTMVPDANGVAVPLTPSMVGLRVRFSDID